MMKLLTVAVPALVLTGCSKNTTEDHDQKSGASTVNHANTRAMKKIAAHEKEKNNLNDLVQKRFLGVKKLSQDIEDPNKTSEHDKRMIEIAESEFLKLNEGDRDKKQTQMELRNFFQERTGTYDDECNLTAAAYKDFLYREMTLHPSDERKFSPRFRTLLRKPKSNTVQNVLRGR